MPLRRAAIVLVTVLVAGLVAPPVDAVMSVPGAAHACCRRATAHCAMPAMACCPARPAQAPDSTGPMATAAAAASPLAPLSSHAPVLVPDRLASGWTQAHAVMASLLKPPRDLLYLQHATFLV